MSSIVTVFRLTVSLTNTDTTLPAIPPYIVQKLYKRPLNWYPVTVNNDDAEEPVLKFKTGHRWSLAHRHFPTDTRRINHFALILASRQQEIAEPVNRTLRQWLLFLDGR